MSVELAGMKAGGGVMPIPRLKTPRLSLTLVVKVIPVKSAGMCNDKKGAVKMNPSEEATLNTARSVLSPVEVEKLAGLIHLRHHASAHVRISANIELIPLLSKLKAKIGVC